MSDELLRQLLERFSETKRPRAFVDETEIPWADEDIGRQFLGLGLRSPEQTREELDFLSDVLNLEFGHRVLDVMCGDGRIAIPMGRAGTRVVGVDINPTAIARARAKAREERLDDVRFELGDVRALALDGEFDVAIIIFGHLSGFPAEVAVEILRGIHRHLCPGGRLLIDMHLSPAYIGALDGQRDWSFEPNGWLGTDHPALVLDEYTTETDLSFVRRSLCIDLSSGQLGRFGQAGQFYNRHSMTRLLADADFEADEFWGDFDGSEYDDDESPNLLVLAHATQ